MEGGESGVRGSDGIDSPRLIVVCVCSWVLGIFGEQLSSFVGVCFHLQAVVSWVVALICGWSCLFIGDHIHSWSFVGVCGQLCHWQGVVVGHWWVVVAGPHGHS